MEIKNSKKEEYDAVEWQSWRTTEEKKEEVDRCWWDGFLSPTFSHEYSGVRYRKDEEASKPRVTNKVMVCDHKPPQKSNTLPLEVALFGSSKASKPAAPHGQTEYSVALILTGQPINWQPNHKQATLPNQRYKKKGDISLPRTRRPITPDVCPPVRPMRRLGLSAGTAERVGWWVVVVVVGGGG